MIGTTVSLLSHSVSRGIGSDEIDKTHEHRIESRMDSATHLFVDPVPDIVRQASQSVQSPCPQLRLRRYALKASANSVRAEKY